MVRLILLALVISASGPFAVEPTTSAFAVQGTPPASGLSAAQARLSSAAQRDWKPFLSKFKTALRRRDRAALLALTTQHAHANCNQLEAEAARRYLFDNNRALDHYLDIVTPGRSKVHRNDEPNYSFDRELDVSRMTLFMSCWG